MTLNLSNASVLDMMIHCEDTARNILRRVVEFYPPMLDSFVDELHKRIDNVIIQVMTNANERKLTIPIKKQKTMVISDDYENQIPISESTQLAKGDSPIICLDDDDHGGSIESEDQNVQDQMNCETRAIEDNETMVLEEDIRSSNDNNWSKPNVKIENHIKTLPTSKISTSLPRQETIHKKTENGEASKIISSNETIQNNTETVGKSSPVVSHEREAFKYRSRPRRGTIQVTPNVANSLPLISREFKVPENVSKKPRL